MSQPRFLLDEHVWGGLVDVGRRIGIDVLLTQAQLPTGTVDEDVLRFAARQQRILPTGNAQDFAPIARQWFLSGQEHWGIVIVPGQTDKGLLSRALENMARHYPAESFKNTVRFWREFV
jgi:hypothetical protein